MAQQYTARTAQFSYTFEGGRNCDFCGDFGVPTRFSILFPMMFLMHSTGAHEFPIRTTLYSFAQNSTFVTYTARPKEKAYIVFSFQISMVWVFFFGVMRQTKKFNHKLSPKNKFKSLWTHAP
jgi:hypothetical protein